MQRTELQGPRTLTWLLVLIVAPLLHGQETTDSPAPQALVATTPHFAFHSDFDTNLNDALVAAGAARAAGEAEPFDAGEEKTCLEEMPPSVRSAWEQAVDWYAEVVSETSWAGRQQWLLRFDLNGLQDVREDERVARFLDIAAALRAAAAPAYSACGWPQQDAANRLWIEHVTSRLTVHEEALGERLSRLYQAAWHGLPIRVDLVPAALPVGASTFSQPPHVLISSQVAERDALEIVFHEAGHTLFRRDDPVPAALAAAADELGVELPRDLWHVVLFVSTGQAVREVLAAAGEPGYAPYFEVHGLGNGHWGPLARAVAHAWPAYLAGEKSLEEAAVELVREATTPPAPPAGDPP